MVRIKLAYPKIPGSQHAPFEQCVAFEKYDGTNMHWSWHHELGWHAFGMRRNRFDFDEAGIAEFHAAHTGFSDAPVIFGREFAAPLEAIFHSNSAYASPDITVFTEFCGPNSFAGKHQPNDPKQLVLFDVETPQGMIGPDQFVADFDSLNIARVVYRGKLTGKFTHAVRSGEYGVAEGVVCKGGTTGNTWMAKIKTDSYMQRLKQAFADDWEAYWE